MQARDQKTASDIETDDGIETMSHSLASRMSTAIGVFTAEGRSTLVNPALASLFPEAEDLQFHLILERLVQADGAPADVSQDLARYGRWCGALRMDAESAQSPAAGAVLTEMRNRSASVIGYICEFYPVWPGPSDATSRSHVDILTARENEVLRGLAAGGSNKAIGRKLNVSSRTIEFHRANIMRKLGVQSLADLLRLIHRG